MALHQSLTWGSWLKCSFESPLRDSDLLALGRMGESYSDWQGTRGKSALIKKKHVQGHMGGKTHSGVCMCTYYILGKTCKRLRSEPKC